MSNKPKIRFKGFTDDWEQRKLGDMGYSYGGLSGKCKEDFGHGNGQYITYMNIFSNSIIDEKKFDSIEIDKSQNEVAKGDAFFTTSSETPEEVGMSSVLAGNYRNLYLNSFCFGYRPTKKIDMYYFAYLLRSDCFRSQVKLLAQGISRFNISKNKTMEITLLFPSLEEQKKIGKACVDIDKLIALHQRKLDKLKKIKKSLLENMFPKDNEKAPKIRFKGFTDDWEQRKLENVLDISRGGSPRPIEAYITKSKNGLNWIKIGDAPKLGNYITETKEKIIPEGLNKTKKVFPGDLILSNSMSFGKPYIMAVEGCIHDGWLLLRDRSKIFDLLFLCIYLSSNIMKKQYIAFAAGSTVNNLNKQLVGNSTIMMPENQEQHNLGEFFTILDDLITLHQRKCEKLKKIKKSLLENMFV